MKIDNFKIKVTPEQSKVVQETLFTNGYKRYMNFPITFNYSTIVLDSDNGIVYETSAFKDIAYPELTYQQFTDLYIPFTLPEYWCIQKNKDNYKIINDYLNTLGHSIRYSNSYSKPNNHHNKTLEFPEITFDQFKKYVLKETDMNKEIIGYKLKFTEYTVTIQTLINTTFNPDTIMKETNKLFQLLLVKEPLLKIKLKK